MEISRGALGVLAAVCVTGGAAAAYLTNRVSPEPVTVAMTTPATSAPVTPAAEAPVPPEPAVAETVAGRVAPRPRLRPAPPAPVRRPVATAATNTPAAASPAPRPEALPATPTVEPLRTSTIPLVPTGQTVVEPAQPVEPSTPQLLDLVLGEDSVIGLQVQTTVTSETAQVEDEVTARVVRDVRVGERVAIPAGSKARGEVTMVERGGRLRDRARLAVRFTSITLPDGTFVPIETEAVYREGDGPGGESAAKIGGGAIGGAIIGGILGGAKGAAIGSGIGAGAGSAAVMTGGRNPATLSAGSPVTVRLEQPATVTVARD